ncbi:MAG: glycosyltransferase [Kiritimatiellia bacterium]
MARILYLYAQVYRSDGLHARQTRQMLALLGAQGHEIDLLTLPGGDAWPHGLIRDRYLTARIPFSRTLALYGYGVRRAIATLFLVFATIRLFMHRRYDVIHCADRSIRVGRIVAWLFGACFIFEWRASSGHNLADWLRHRSKRFCRSVGLVLSDAPQSLAQLRTTGLCGRIAVIPLLPSPDIVRCMPPSVRLLGETVPFRVVAFSNVKNLSDLRILIEALPDLASISALRVKIVGGVRSAVERLRQTLSEERPELLSQITFYGALQGIEDLNAQFAEADVVFLPMVVGVQPPPMLLDAMMAQRAIVAIRCPANEQLLSHENATLVPADARSLAAAFLRYVRAPLLSTTHAQAAAEAIDRERNPSSFAASLRACYAFALSEKPR